MRKKLLLLFAALLVAGCGEKSSPEDSPRKTDIQQIPEQNLKGAVDIMSLEERNGVYYRTNESEPFSGWAKNMFATGNLGGLMEYKDGKMDGLSTQYYFTGQKLSEDTYKRGKQDGPFTKWHSNGQRLAEGNYKDGKLDGLKTEWSILNGKKKSEYTYKDGKEDGPYTRWHENGQKQAQGICKDGGTDSAKYWNRKGEEVETFAEAVE